MESKLLVFCFEKKLTGHNMRIISVGTSGAIDGYINEFMSPFNSFVGIEKTDVENLRKVIKDEDIVVVDSYEHAAAALLIRKENPETRLIFVLARQQSGKTPLELINEGADECLTMPCAYGVFEGVMKKYFNEAVENRMIEAGDNFGIIGESRQIRYIKKFIRKVASSSIPVLIEGESGTGKELVAHAVHKVSARTEQPFIPVNCSAIPKDLLENEFFGHEKGSFTGAVSVKKGLFEIADKGTLFIDEIGEMEIGAQVKLLRVLETGKFMRIGGTQEIRVDVRIVAATNREIKEEIAAGRFRKDLFYRISAIMIKLPSLRERKEDIPVLASHFLKNSKIIPEETVLKTIGPDAMKLLCDYKWPGNVRELLNVIEQSVLVSERSPEISIADLLRYLHAAADDNTVLMPDKKPEGSLVLEEYMDAVEKDFIKNVLEKSGHDKIQAAQTMKISIANLYRKLKKYNLD